MTINWFKRLATSALALTLGSGMFVLAGCNNHDDCDPCDEKPVRAAYHDEDVKVHAVHAGYEERTEYRSTERRDFDNDSNVYIETAPNVDMGTKPAVRARQN